MQANDSELQQASRNAAGVGKVTWSMDDDDAEQQQASTAAAEQRRQISRNPATSSSRRRSRLSAITSMISQSKDFYSVLNWPPSY